MYAELKYRHRRPEQWPPSGSTTRLDGKIVWDDLVWSSAFIQQPPLVGYFSRRSLSLTTMCPVARLKISGWA